MAPATPAPAPLQPPKIQPRAGRPPTAEEKLALLQAKDMVADLHFHGFSRWTDPETGKTESAVLPGRFTGERPATPDGAEVYHSLVRQAKSSTLPPQKGLTEAQREFPGHLRVGETASSFCKAEEPAPYVDYMRLAHPKAIAFDGKGPSDPPIPFGFNCQPGAGGTVHIAPFVWGTAHTHTDSTQGQILPSGKVVYPEALGPSLPDLMTHVDGRMQSDVRSYLLEWNPKDPDRPIFSEYGFDTGKMAFFNTRIHGMPAVSSIAPGPIFDRLPPKETHFISFPETPAPGPAAPPPAAANGAASQDP